MAQNFAQILELFLHQQTSRRLLHETGDAHGGSMSAMRSSKSIVDVVVRQAGKLLGKLGVIGFLFGMKAEVFEQQRLALFQLSGHLFGLGADALGAESHIFSAG